MKDRVTSFIFPALTLLGLVALWHFSIDLFAIPDYLLPRPSSVISHLKTGYIDGAFWPHFAFTLQSTATGYLLGCVSAILVGAALAESRTFEKCFYPFIVALQSMPKVALAPLIIVWFGYGAASKVVMVALMCFFPLFVNTVVGIRQTDRQLVSMMRSFSAPASLVFFRVKLYAAAGHIFAGLQISIVLALIGAVVAEFVASSKGIGWLIQSALANFNTAQMFAALLSLVAIGLVGTQAVQFLHRRVVFWEQAAPMTALPE